MGGGEGTWFLASHCEICYEGGGGPKKKNTPNNGGGGLPKISREKI